MDSGSEASQTTVRLQGNRFLLTYPRCDADPEQLVLFLKELPYFERCIVAREQHEDGGNHLHAAVEFQRRLQRKFDFFDFDGTHGNYQSCASWGKCVNYCRKNKGGEIIYENCTPEDAALARVGGRTQSDYIAECETRPRERDWYAFALRERIPYAYAEKFWKICHAPRAKTYDDDPGEGSVPNFQLLATVPGPVGTYNIVVCGPSGAGKTTWALRHAPKPCILITHKDELRWFDETYHKSIVFDEIRCTGETDGWNRRGKWPLVEQIKLLTSDTPVSLHVRYGVARIPPKVVKIFTCTDTVLFTEDAQIKRRIHQLVNLYDHENIWSC
uniref:Replication-associated protein n=1 Tax=Cressdnaviricota sp. TaxID=2748378 RepID=A0A6M3YPI9_9VIRU|nr:MAG: replication-associated protein [Cressdnaviricota sp.]